MQLKKHTLVLSLAALGFAGCVSRSEMDAAKQQLDQCEKDKGEFQRAANDCTTHLETESKRWNSIESQLTSTLPQTLREFQDERNKIIQLVPEEVRNQVGSRLDRYFVTVSKQFERMDGKVEGLNEQLALSRQQLVELASATRSVDSKIDATHKALLSGQQRQGVQSSRVGAVVAMITDFDSAKISCDKCKDKIKLKGKGKQELLAFHGQLIKQLQSLDGTAEGASAQ